MACSFRLQRFCCCCTVRTGSLVIGTIGWVFTLVKLFGFVIPSNQNQHMHMSEKEREINEIFQSVNNNSLGIRIGYAVVALLVSVLLLWGIYKKDHRFMLPYLVVQCIECILVSILAGFFFIIIFFVPAEVLAVAIIGFALISLCAVLYWYFWLCVWSHYKDLTDGAEHPSVYYSPTSASPAVTEKDRQHMI